MREEKGKEKKQFTPIFLHQPSFYAKNVLTSLSPLARSYLQGALNFEFANLKPGLIVASAEKANKEPKSKSVSTQDADALSSQQVRSIRTLQYESALKKDIEPGREDLFFSFRDVKALKENIHSFHDSFFPVPLINLERFDHIIKKTSSRDVDTDVTYDSGELVFKKPASQKNEIVTENKGNVQTKKIFPTETHEDPRKEFFKEKKIQDHEIGIIADRVYRIIEKRISIEKDRRGLF
jgi:hypothetical protein